MSTWPSARRSTGWRSKRITEARYCILLGPFYIGKRFREIRDPTFFSGTLLFQGHDEYALRGPGRALVYNGPVVGSGRRDAAMTRRHLVTRNATRLGRRRGRAPGLRRAASHYRAQSSAPPGSGGGGSSGLAAHKPDGPSVVRECARPHPHGHSRSSASLVDHRGWPPPLRSARVEVDRRLSTRRACKAAVALVMAAACSADHHSTARRRAACRGHVTPWLAHLWRGSVLLAKFVGG